MHNAACQSGTCGKRGSLCRHGFIPRRGSRRPAQWSLGALRHALLLNHPPGKRWRSLPNIPTLGCICQLYSLHELQGGGWVPHSNRLSLRTGKTIYYQAFRDLIGRWSPLQQPVFHESHEFSGLGTGWQMRLILPLIEVLSGKNRV